MSLYSYGANLMTQKMTIKECIEHAASLGVEGIELVDNRHIPNYPYQSIYDLQDLREYVESFGMKVSCYSTYIEEPKGSSDPLEDFVKIFKKQIVETKILGINIIRPAFFPPRGMSFAKFAGYSEKLIQDLAPKILPYCKKQDTIWAAEIHAPNPPEVFLKLVKEINNEYFRLVPDFSGWQTKGIPGAAGASSIELFKKCIPYSVHVHAKAHVFDENGEEPGTPYVWVLNRKSE
jgi:sugar phosphate isomerase/epimerase